MIDYVYKPLLYRDALIVLAGEAVVSPPTP